MIKNCHYCQVSKINKRIYGEPLGSVITKTPLKDISSDVFGPFDASNYIHNFKKDKLFIITFTDRCTPFSKCHFTTKITSKQLIKSFKHSWLKKFSTPLRLLSDNGKCYTSSTTSKFFKERKIKQVFSAPYNPTCNSLSEELIRQLLAF
ncbi:Pro-Pol polyprotein [Dictyocoela muelleri]|nr:Pro-Pol polyprotein [Dictyocoela muelleri]